MNITTNKKITIELDETDIKKMRLVVEYLDELYNVIGERRDSLTFVCPDGTDWNVNRDKFADAILECGLELGDICDE